MADIQTLMDQIPEGSQYEMIRDAIIRVNQTFPDQMPEITPERVRGWVSDVDAGRRSAPDIRDDIFQFVVTPEVIQERLGVSMEEAWNLINRTAGTQFATSANVQAQGDVNANDEAPLTILYGREMNWFFDRSTNNWYVSYGVPSSDRELLFEADADQMDALFGPGGRPLSFQMASLEELTNRDTVTFAGNVAEMQGEGTFEEEWVRMQRIALDSGVLPEWARNDPAAMDLVAIGLAEKKSVDWTIEQIAKLPSFKQRFPGIEHFKNQGLTTSESVGAFIEYEAGLKELEKQFGGDPSNITPETVGALAGKGFSLKQVEQSYTVFKRLSDYAPALEAFNAVLQANQLEPLSVEDQYEFLLGRAPQEVYDIYEASSIREAAVAEGLDDALTGSEALDAALQTAGTLSPDTIASGMRQAAQLVLRHRQGIAQGRLTQEDLIDMSLGLVPRSGLTAAEIQEEISRMVSEARAFQKGVANPYTAFSSTGVPRAASLGESSRQSV